MSSFNINDIEVLDERTKKIVFWYIKSEQLALCENEYYTIPLDIIYIILYYIRDHFVLNRGVYKWTIAPKLLNKMLLSSNTETYHSPQFEIGKLIWQINAYP
eukprot:375314_1